MHGVDAELSPSLSSRSEDKFFVVVSVLLPIVAQTAYIFDVFYYHLNSKQDNGYEGLLSSVLSVFAYLQYCVPIRSRCTRFFYHLFLWILSEIGTLGHLILCDRRRISSMILYSLSGLVDSIYCGCLIYCRVFSKDRYVRVHMAIEQRHLFRFISRLEVILAIFIPIFFDTRFITLTRDNIAFYILFDFFAEYYHRFHGLRVKAVLYVFVGTVTASVTLEWIHLVKHDKNYEIASSLCELLASCLCYSLIIMQFFPNNFISRKKLAKHRRRQTVSSIASQQTYHSRHSFDSTVEKHICYF
ncbi:unnamed protein product [Rotaria socialis]|uniref:Uncharacterized protein n=1 Tax=Rotaria socialis TaxID=392032 RepID=A0A818NUG7_9BILA|nr:unnamed protein product [Rotaria socialis]CAF3295158.1 unnamed protein product [Rotaria socialis]CAF3443768.1 unnamed protein product [Rotaria socialis]CAF3518081.1 unnamed protein product [Rotaria socialis]CAF3610335.1 unnamed protein product [Rotaria socialis]